MVKDFIPISCCTVIYKILSIIFSKRLGKVLGSIIYSSQDAFVPGKKIHDHILLDFELIRGYRVKSGAPKCMIQMDLHKAYDTVDYGALESTMGELNFPYQFINWTMLTFRVVSYKFQNQWCALPCGGSQKGPYTMGSPITLVICCCYGILTRSFLEP